ncbi:MAG: hypothetical protein APF81_25505 [Desulfosporosinus sp. BRH_c37]|nr:MAG: hypothetical protein APF81_25505 [Desulfosporosinus sp. BRH_c37]
MHTSGKESADMNISFLFKDDFLTHYDLFSKHCPPPLSLPKGSIICKKGISSKWMYYLNEGTLKVYSDNYTGYERIIAYLKRNSIFGLDCFHPEMSSIVTIEAVTDVWVMPFTSGTLRIMMAENSDFAFDLVAYYCKVMRQLCSDAENLSINDATIRLVNFLFLYINGNDSGIDTIDMTQQELASAINCSRSCISRICARLKNDGIIKINGKGLSVSDKRKLEELCRF